jgi:hypothetical protein
MLRVCVRTEEETADLSTTLRSGRDDKFVVGKLPAFQSTHSRKISTNLSSRPERTRISCHAALETTACAAFSKESRMKFANATNTKRKFGVA